MVRGDVDEVVVLLPEDRAAHARGHRRAGRGTRGRVAAGVSLSVSTSRVRWGAKIADPTETDPDQLIGDARAALDKAQRAGEPGSIDRTPSSFAADG